MTIEVKDTLSVGGLRQKFSAHFPYLRLEFFLLNDGGLPLASLRITDESILLGSIRRSHIEGELAISAHDTVKKLEDAFRNRFGLNVQVFHRSGNSWMLTTSTDNYTLERLNALGIEMAEPVPPPEPTDVHEQD